MSFIQSSMIFKILLVFFSITCDCRVQACQSGGENVIFTNGNCTLFYEDGCPETQDDAIEVCRTTHTGIVTPATNHTDQIEFFTNYINNPGNPICGKLWTGLSYDADDEHVQFSDGSTLRNDSFLWSSGSPPTTSEPCLVAESIPGEKVFTLSPNDCESPENFLCISVTGEPSCGMSIATYGSSCSRTCVTIPNIVPTDMTTSEVQTESTSGKLEEPSTTEQTTQGSTTFSDTSAGPTTTTEDPTSSGSRNDVMTGKIFIFTILASKLVEWIGQILPQL